MARLTCVPVSRLVAAGGLITTVLTVQTAALAAEPAPAGGAPAGATPANAAPSAEGGQATVKSIGPNDATKPQDEANAAEAPPPDAAQAEQAKTAADKQRELEVAQALDGNSPVELPGETYYLLGARYRGILVPKFMQNIFASGGEDVYVHAFGPEFGIRKNGFEINLSAWLAFYSFDDMAFKGKNDNKYAWELLNSNMKLLYFTSDFLWSHEFTPQVALNYGVGVGLGFVFGDLFRNQSRPDDPLNPGDPKDFSRCGGPRPAVPGQEGYDPATGQTYCDDSNNHYGNYSEPNWANGGSKPIVFPWLALQTGLRFKPSRSFVARLDLGFGTSGFFFGVGADYGL
jgi:hypothetical protein